VEGSVQIELPTAPITRRGSPCGSHRKSDLWPES